MRAFRAAASAALALSLAVSAQAREAFYVTPVPDDATRFLAANRDGDVIPYYSESHALLIGNSNYTEFTPSLPGVKTEVARLADVLHQHRFKVEVHFDLTASEMVSVIDTFMRRHATVDDSRILVYVSGHGVSIPLARPFGYLVPVDAPNEEAAGRQAVANASMPMQLFGAWAQMPAPRHMLFVFDACFSGSFFGRVDGPPPPAPVWTQKPPTPRASSAESAAARRKALANLSGPETEDFIFRGGSMSLGRQFITAGGANQTVPAKSVFTDLFIQILEGSDLTPEVNWQFDHWLTGKELGDWLVGKASTFYGNPANAPVPVFGTLQDNMFMDGNIVFTRLDIPNPNLKVEPPPAPQPPPFPEPGTVVQKVAASLLSGAVAQAPQSSAPRSEPLSAEVQAFQVAVGLTRRAGLAEATASMLEAEERRQQRPPFRSMRSPGQAEGQQSLPSWSTRSAEQARLEAESARARADQALATVEEQVSSAVTDRTQSPEAGRTAAEAARTELVALSRRVAPVPQRQQEQILSAEEERALQDIVNDFPSQDTPIRRESRRKMARFLEQMPQPKAAVATSRLLQNLSQKGYRFQLGMATALRILHGPVHVEDAAAARAELERALSARAGQEPELRKNLLLALNRIPRS